MQRKHLRLAIHQRQHDRAESFLHLRVLVQVVEHDSGIHVAFEFDDDAHALAVALVADIADAFKTLVMHQLGDLRDQHGLIDHVRDFRHDDALTAVRHRLDFRFGARDDTAAAGGIRVVNALAAEDDTAGREIRAFDALHQLLRGHIRVVDHLNHAVDDLAEVMRRNIRRHADRNAGRAVDQQIREAAGQHVRLHQRFVEVRGEIDGLFIDVRQHLHVDFAHARFGITHGRRAVAVHRAKVALAVHQRIAGCKILTQAHQRAIHGGVAVRVIFTQNVANDTRALTIRLIRRDTEFVHRVQNAAMHRLEAVAHIRQRAGDDNRHCVGDERFLHLVLKVNRADALKVGCIAGEIILKIQLIFPFLRNVLGERWGSAPNPAKNLRFLDFPH